MAPSLRKRLGHWLWSSTPPVASLTPASPDHPTSPIPRPQPPQLNITYTRPTKDISPTTATSTAASPPPPTVSFGPPKIKTMRAGKCSKPFCSCPEGVFDMPIPSKDSGYGMADEPTCGTSERVGCGHELSVHENTPLDSIMVPNRLVRMLKCPDYTHGDPSQIRETPIRDPVSRDPAVCPRRVTVENLWSLVREVRVVQCRGTPTSGKSTLARLLESFVLNNCPDMQVVYMSWPSSALPDEQTQPFDVMIKKYAGISWEGPSIFELSNLLLICDEAQNSYPFHAYWNDFIKMQASGANAGPYIVMFSSFGSPAATAVPFPGSAPPYLSLEQRLAMRPPNYCNRTASLYFPRPEFDDVVQRVCGAEDSVSGQFLLSKDLVDYLYDITSGHPGCVRAILNVLIKSELLRPFRRENRAVDLTSALSVVRAPNFFDNLGFSVGFGRSLPPKKIIQENPEAAKVLQNAVVQHNVIGELERDRGLDIAYKRGWLHAELTADEQIHYIFPTEIHRLYCEKLLTSNNEKFPLDLYGSLTEFWLAAVKGFSSGCLSNSGRVLSGGGVMRPLESIYQDELYRSCYKILHERCFLISEWGASQEGRIDFFVGGGVKWGIECLREGINLDEHISRFQPGGRYHSWIQDGCLADYVILDFRKTIPAVFKNFPRLYHVIYNSDYTECQILQSDGTEKTSRFRLLN